MGRLCLFEAVGRSAQVVCICTRGRTKPAVKPRHDYFPLWELRGLARRSQTSHSASKDSATGNALQMGDRGWATSTHGILPSQVG